ncbi:MAG TPA: YCF48-related protein [Thermoanaerobaculia bacterium]
MSPSERLGRGLLGLLLAFSLAPARARAQANTWISMGLEGGDALNVVVDPTDSNVAYVGTYGGGIFKTTDGGAHWSHAGRLLYEYNGVFELTYVTALAIDPSHPSTLWAATGAILFKSDDAGASWTDLDIIDPNEYGYIWLLKVDPGDPKRVYAGTDYPALYRSEDGGHSWKNLNAPIFYGAIVTVAIDPTDRDRLSVGAYANSGARSSDGGKTWTPINLLSVYSLALDPDDPQTVYLGTYGGGMWKATGDADPVEINEGFTNHRVLSVAAGPSGQIWAATDGGGIFRSIDGGNHWTPSSDGLKNGWLETLVLDPNDSESLWAGMQGAGVFHSSSSGDHWLFAGGGIEAPAVEIVATHPRSPDTVFAALRGFGLAKTATGGTDWLVGSSGPAYPDFRGVSFDSTDATKVFAAEAGGLVRSLDGGATWQDRSPAGYTDFRAVSVAPSSSDTVYASAFGRSGSSSVFRSDDGGDHWTPANAGLEGLITSFLLVDPADASHAFAIVSGYSLFETVDAGATWAFGDPTRQMNAQALAESPSDPDVLYAGADGVMFKSADRGASWLRLPDAPALSTPLSLTIDPLDSQTIYALSSYGGLLKSIDGARTWDSLPSPAGRIPSSLAIDPNDASHLYAGVYGEGVFEMHQSAPSVFSISPSSGPAAGGTGLTITGSGFEGGATARFGIVPSAGAQYLDASHVAATAPALPTGFSDVMVANANGQAAILPRAWFSDFADVPQSYVLHDAIVRVARAGITTGCGTGGFCPDAFVSRSEMAIFLLRAEHGADHHPPPATGSVFADVPPGGFAAAWIEEFAGEGITKGCGGGNYCPTLTISRGEMAVFVLRTVHGATFRPPDPAGIYSDVPVTHPFARWIEELAAEGISSGCGGGKFCPADAVSRAHLAGFLARAFHLP